MTRSWSDEAIVLKTYNVGETDRFCILLTKNYGRVAARARSVRKGVSKRMNGLMPFHRTNVTCEQHSFGTVITASTCIDAHDAAWRDPHSFSCAMHGVELLLKLIEDGEPVPEVYALASKFLDACTRPHPAHLASVFSLQLLQLLGSLPSASHSSLSHARLTDDVPVVFSRGGLALKSEDRYGMTVSPALRSLLLSLPTLNLAALPVLAAELAEAITATANYLVGNQLGVELASPAVGFAMSSGLTPTCHVSGRAS